MDGHVGTEPRHAVLLVASDVASAGIIPLVDYLDAPLLAVGVASVSISRAQVPDAPPSSVSFVPAELAPFAVRCGFRFVEDADGSRREALVEPPGIIETASSLREHAEATREYQYMLESHRWAYWRIAERLLDFDVRGAVAEREVMLQAQRRKVGSRRQWTRLERFALLREFEERRGNGEGRGLQSRLADDRGIQVSGISRQLHLARAERDELSQ
jgi:hypothetical protein